MYKITIVCTANICRSPMGEAILWNLVKQNHMEDKIEVLSAGLLGIEGERASDLAVTVAHEHGLNLEDHRSKGITPQMIKMSNVVLCMTPEHKTELQSDFPSYRDKIYTLKEYLSKGEVIQKYIDDPIGLSLNFYRRVFNEIKIELERIFPEIIKMIRKN